VLSTTGRKAVAIVVLITVIRSFYVLRWDVASVMVVVREQFNVIGRGRRRVEKGNQDCKGD
jgi:hypothetical protein